MPTNQHITYIERAYKARATTLTLGEIFQEIDEARSVDSPSAGRAIWILQQELKRRAEGAPRLPAA